MLPDGWRKYSAYGKILCKRAANMFMPLLGKEELRIKTWRCLAQKNGVRVGPREPSEETASLSLKAVSHCHAKPISGVRRQRVRRKHAGAPCPKRETGMKRKRPAERTRDVLGSRMKTHDVCAARPCPDPGRRLRGRCAARGSAPRRLRRRSEDTWPGHLRGDAAAPPDACPGPTRHQGAPHCPGGGGQALSRPRGRGRRPGRGPAQGRGARPPFLTDVGGLGGGQIKQAWQGVFRVSPEDPRARPPCACPGPWLLRVWWVAGARAWGEDSRSEETRTAPLQGSLGISGKCGTFSWRGHSTGRFGVKNHLFDSKRNNANVL